MKTLDAYSVKVTVASASIQYRKLATTAQAVPCKCKNRSCSLLPSEHLHAVRQFAFIGTRQKPVYCQRSYESCLVYLMTCITARRKKGAKEAKVCPLY